MKKIDFDRIYYEENIEDYPLGKYLLKKYKHLEKIKIKSHNNIEELRAYENKDFSKLKRYLIIGTRKTHKYSDNYKISNYIVPFTSSGCSAMCMYCYLVCNYSKCSYLRVFVNTDDIFKKLLKTSNDSEKELVFEIGSNSDLLLEDQVTNHLKKNIEFFLENTNKGILTFPTKFNYIEPLLTLDHKNRVLVRMSLNPSNIIRKVEFGTSNLDERLEAINKLSELGYPTHILIAPIIITESFKDDYTELIYQIKDKLSDKAKEYITFELIFMTYSYIHRKINEEAFPKAINLYSTELMTSRGVGKYHYKNSVKEECKILLHDLIYNTFKNCEIKYTV